MKRHIRRQLKGRKSRGAWVAQSVKSPALDFGSRHDLTVGEFEPNVGLCANSAEPAWDPCSPLYLAPPALSLPLSLKKQIN